MAKKKLIGRNRPTARRQVLCYFCGRSLDVSTKTLSTTCPGCHKAIKVEDVVIKNYLPVNDVQTCGLITVTKRGRIAAKRIQSGDGVVCEGSIEGKVETPGPIQLGPKSSWKGDSLSSRTLEVDEGAKLNGHVTVPCAAPKANTADQKHSRLVRRVETPDPTASLVVDGLEPARIPPKSAQVTEPKPSPKPTVKPKTTPTKAPSSKRTAPATKKKKTTTKKKITKAQSTTAAKPRESTPAVKVIRTRAVRSRTDATSAATSTKPAATGKKTTAKKKKTTRKAGGSRSAGTKKP